MNKKKGDVHKKLTNDDITTTTIKEKNKKKTKKKIEELNIENIKQVHQPMHLLLFLMMQQQQSHLGH